MAKTYELGTTVSPSSLLARAKKAAYANSASLSGDEGLGALLTRVGKRRVPHGGAEGGRHHNGQALAAALAIVEVRLRELLASA